MHPCTPPKPVSVLLYVCYYLLWLELRLVKIKPARSFKGLGILLVGIENSILFLQNSLSFIFLVISLCYNTMVWLYYDHDNVFIVATMNFAVIFFKSYFPPCGRPTSSSSSDTICRATPFYNFHSNNTVFFKTMIQPRWYRCFNRLMSLSIVVVGTRVCYTLGKDEPH